MVVTVSDMPRLQNNIPDHFSSIQRNRMAFPRPVLCSSGLDDMTNIEEENPKFKKMIYFLIFEEKAINTSLLRQRKKNQKSIQTSAVS